ncbi:hypothetical protein [Kitasatospora sp. NPDC058190]|uniref:hypothetical protein n=1 Tax=Kitasatospora sp. NPDC058190 TaxID=3346371 RepID=UPI0036DEF1E8
MTIEDDEGALTVLESKEQMVRHANLTQYPPKGEAYSLQKPVELIQVGHPEKVEAHGDGIGRVAQPTGCGCQG